MRAARLGMHLHQRCFICQSLRPEPFHDLELSDRFARRGRPGRDFLPVFGVASNGQLHAAHLALYRPPDQRQVDPTDGMGLELLRETLMRRIGLGDHHHAARALVQPMDEAGPLAAADRKGDRFIFWQK